MHVPFCPEVTSRLIYYLQEIGAHTILGNHELHLISVASGHRAQKNRDTFKDILQAPDRDRLIQWLCHCPLIKVWDDIILVHAGLPPAYLSRLAEIPKIERQISKGQVPWHDSLMLFLTTVRLCNEKGRQERGYQPFGGFKPWNEFYNDSKVVVCGHWAERGLIQQENIRALDTGCVWGKQLTAWVAEEDQLYSVPALDTYQKIRYK